MSVQAEGQLVGVDLDGFAYGSEAIDVLLSQGNISHFMSLDEFEESRREQQEEAIEHVESPDARPPSPVPPQEVKEEAVDPSSPSPPVQEVKEEAVKEEAHEEQTESPAAAPTTAAPPVLLQHVKQEEKDESDEKEEDPDVPGPSHGRPATRKRKKKFECGFCDAKFDDPAARARHEITHLPPDEQREEAAGQALETGEELAEPPIKRERSDTLPVGVKGETANEQAPESRPSTSFRLPPPQRQLVSQEVVRDKIRELEQKPVLLYLDVQAMTEDAATWLVNYWKRMPHCKVLVLRVKEVPLRTKYALKPPIRMVQSDRASTDFLYFYCKPEATELRAAIRQEAPDPLSFRELAEELIPILEIPCALLVPDAVDRNSVNVAALALLNVFVV